nr:type III-B CRISPR-associated protein Cas10/Cmr2 [Paenibacillus roseus]
MLFSIGPVQEFIAQARKTRDLWFGSYLLAELAKAAAIAFTEHGGDLIFPASNQIQAASNSPYSKVASVANKVLGIIATDDPRAVALAIRRAVDLKWRDYASQAEQLLNQKINHGIWKRQIKDVIEFYAVWNRMDKPYKNVLEDTEGLMAARKTLKDFRQNDPAAIYGDIKSTLDGGRESVLYKERYEEYSRYGIKNREALDAISMVKRLSRYTLEEREFKSVCDVAFQSFITKIGEPDARIRQIQAGVIGYYEELKAKYSNDFKLTEKEISQYDTRLFYENRMEEFVAEKAIKSLSQDEQTKYVQCFTEELRTFYAKIGIEPTPYYAFLMCDGDRIGKQLRKLQTPEEHKNFTKSLSEFAEKAEEVIRNYNGQLVYSGGDDVMAYLPLNSCLLAVDELRRQFGIKMAEAFPDSVEQGTTPTLSVGLAIVHMLEMLEDARKLALSAEKAAKQERNALALHFQKRHGGDALKFTISFDADPITNIGEIQALYRKGTISYGFAYELRSLYKEYQALLPKQTSEHGVRWKTNIKELLNYEVARLIAKKHSDKAKADQAVQEVLPLFRDIKGEPEEVVHQFAQVAEQFIVAVTLVKEGDPYEQDDTHTAS